MRRIWSIAVGVVLLSAAAARDAAAQWNVERFDTQRNRVYTTFGLDPALITSLGYARVIAIAGHDFQLSGEVGVVTARLDRRDYRVRLGTQTSLAVWRSLQFTGKGSFITRGTDNAVYRGLNLGADLTGALGVYRRGWFAAGELGKDKAIITHVTHTDWYREHYHPDAKDGWYLDAGGTYHYGVTAGVTVGRAELTGRAGWLRTEHTRAIVPPVYASAGVGFSF